MIELPNFFYSGQTIGRTWLEAHGFFAFSKNLPTFNYYQLISFEHPAF